MGPTRALADAPAPGIELSVNGAIRTTAAGDGVMLSHVLRDEFDLKGVRIGCGIGACGACTVLVDDAPRRACSTALYEVRGCRIETPEGLGTPEAPHPLQQAFLDNQASQCGYCINGIIMTVAGLARAGCTDSTEVHSALDDHLCRCGTHVRIVAAAESALGIATCGLAGTCAGDRSGDSKVTADDIQRPSPTKELPDHIVTHPLIEQWLQLEADGTLTILAGKVEIGQGILTALTQIAAAQLSLPVERIRVSGARTGRAPDQRFTAGSLSVEEAGTAVALAGAALRRMVVARASEHLRSDPRDVQLDASGATRIDGGPHVTWNTLLEQGPFSGRILPTDEPNWCAKPIGEEVHREDLTRKLTGAAAYVHDIDGPGILRVRAVLPPERDAKLVEAPLDRVRELPGVVDVLVDGELVLVLANSDDRALAAAGALRRDLVWATNGPGRPVGDLEQALRVLPGEILDVRADAETSGAPPTGANTYAATYTTPYQSHGSVAPAAALARFEDGALHVWSSTQGIYPLQRELAALFDLDVGAVTVEHVDGPGCYGMNGADDAAAIAAHAALAHPGVTLRFQFTVDDEFGWTPYGSAMVIEESATVGPDGTLLSWEHQGLGDVHKARPNGSGKMLLPAWLRSHGTEGRPWSGPEEGGGRNAVPIYAIERITSRVTFVRGPMRASSLRCLGAFANLFAIESFVDELADLVGLDRVEFRRKNLRDPRARAVLDLVTERAGWTPHVGPSGRGLGIAVARYKQKAYVAVAASVTVDSADGRVAVTDLHVACDAGRIINPDGLRNQLEGGAVQGLSRALIERADPDGSRTAGRDWTTYPTLRFRDVPRISVHLIERPGHRPLGVGEAVTPVVPAAVANAINDAIGVRLRALPLDAAQLERRLLSMSAEESRRVLL